ncbi:4Fe-4S dicluster domain-containing protein [Ferruginibacter sp. SUN002]|uniref:4Fe-4S dicluster domain-containing protein n=1 Tax=Ferruginibacter sp. SUN002 TaxID=2937789 RepID=UPI003D362F8A
MHLLQQILFAAIAVFAIGLFTKNILQIRRNILLGKDEDLSDNKSLRWKNLLLLAFGQKKMFRNPLVAVMHFVIYAGFIIINIEVLEIVLDGILGTHRLFFPTLGSFYTFLINFFEILAVGVIIVCAVFLIRRNIIKLKRFINKDLNGWPRSDANYILITEIILMLLFLKMNGLDRAIQLSGAEHYYNTGNFIISGMLAPIYKNMFSTSTLIIFERTCWWLHIIGILAFLNYLPYSKHLHIMLAFPNAYYARLEVKGKMDNMKSVQNEVIYAMQPELAPTNADTQPIKFGSKDVFDLSWKSLLDAYSCTECGRCSAACPANQTGKLLSPRKIMMDTRDRLEAVGKNINQNKTFTDDGRNLFNHITVEELRACTTCNACVEECPVSISPLSIILEMRRSLIMEDSNAPQEWNVMFGNVENNFAPWKFSPDERDKWTEEIS